jgi:prepilin-type N-terminal cleavage/methylation domain-containing protein
MVFLWHDCCRNGRTLILNVLSITELVRNRGGRVGFIVNWFKLFYTVCKVNRLTNKGGSVMKWNRIRRANNSNGFTLIEVLLVAVIIGILLAVIVPRAIRARVDSKYGLIKQNCSELASYAAQWAEKGIRASDDSQSTATFADYYASLVGQSQAAPAGGQQWVASDTPDTNWSLGGTVPNPIPAISGRVAVTGRVDGAGNPDAVPEDVVEQMVPPEKSMVNPFNGTNIFRQTNDPVSNGNTPVTGAVALGYLQTAAAQGQFYYFAFGFIGTDNTTAELTANTTFHGGQDLTTIQGLKNGPFMAQVR